MTFLLSEHKKRFTVADSGNLDDSSNHEDAKGTKKKSNQGYPQIAPMTQIIYYVVSQDIQFLFCEICEICGYFLIVFFVSFVFFVVNHPV